MVILCPPPPHTHTYTHTPSPPNYVSYLLNNQMPIAYTKLNGIGCCRYDKHREEILRGAGSDYKDDSVNLMPYFSASVFSGYGDDPKV